MLDEDLVIGVCLQIVDTQPNLTRAAIRLLDSFCWASTEGLEAVLLGLKMLRDEEEYPTRFHAIVSCLTECDDLEARYYLMRFINSLVESPLDEQERNSIRSEFLTSGVKDAIKVLKSIYKLDRLSRVEILEQNRGTGRRDRMEAEIEESTSPENQRRHGKKLKTYMPAPDELPTVEE